MKKTRYYIKGRVLPEDEFNFWFKMYVYPTLFIIGLFILTSVLIIVEG